jgi:ribosomal protein S6--L-glutamate ligase
MRLAVLASPESWYLNDLRRAAGPRHEVVGMAFSHISARLDRGSQWSIHCGEHRLNDFDAVLVRTMPPGSLEQVVFRMDTLGRLADSGVVVLNPPRAVEAAVDKYLTSAKLQAAGLPTPRTIVCQSAEDALDAFAGLGGNVVVKPLFGSEGRGIMRVEDEALALRVFKALAQTAAVIYLQEYIPHNGYDIRLLVVGDDLYCMRRCNDRDWRTNVSRGAWTEPLVPGQTLMDMARCAAAAVGAPLAGIDILPDTTGDYHVLEVNAVPGWKALSRTVGVDIAARMLDYVESQVMAGRSTSAITRGII